MRIVTQPRAKRREIVGLQGDYLKIRITSPPVDGKANAELLDLLAHAFGVPRSRVTQLQGLTGKLKVFLISTPTILPHGLDLERDA